MRSPVFARTPADLKTAMADVGTVSFVPTMGALHGGHEHLMRHACELGETLVVSIFVNPTQFGPDEDFTDYPRTLDADLAVCTEAGVDIVFAPTVETMYPGGVEHGIRVDPGPLGRILEGRTRPTHFIGVLTVVSKLFTLIQPDFAVFGEKDYQQLSLIRSMAREFFMDTKVVGAPTVREPDGLAMSSRNRYLDETEHQQALALSRALTAGVNNAASGVEAVLKAAHSVVDDADGVELDYLVLTNPDLEQPVPGQEARLLIEARVGSARLLDNTGLTLGL